MSIDFNPRTCTRCDGRIVGDTELAFVISIHAPARGAIQPERHRQAVGYFNPRTCTRCDEVAKPATTARLISIHAPARGAI